MSDKDFVNGVARCISVVAFFVIMFLAIDQEMNKKHALRLQRILSAQGFSSVADSAIMQKQEGEAMLLFVPKYGLFRYDPATQSFTNNM